MEGDDSEELRCSVAVERGCCTSGRHEEEEGS
jgi:hypothetical protein